MPTRKRKKTIRYEPDTLDQIAYVAERMDTRESTLMRRLLTSHKSIETLYREWQRIEREVSKLGSKHERKLEDRRNALMDRLGELSEAEQHLLDEIQAELRVRAKEGEPESTPEEDEPDPIAA